MNPGVVVVAHELGDEAPQLLGRRVLVCPQPLRLQGPEPPLHQHVVPPAGPAVHALRDAVRCEERDVDVRAEDRPLVGVHDGGCAVLGEGPPHAPDDILGPHRVRQPPAHDVAAVPVDHGGEVHVVATYLDVGDVRRPHLVGEEDLLAFEQVGEPLRALGWFGERGKRAAGSYVHLVHEARHVPAGDVLAVLPELPGDLPRPVRGVVRMDPVYLCHEALVLLGGLLLLPALVVGGASRYAQELRGPLAGDAGMLTRGLPAPLPGRSRTRRKTAGGSRARR